MKTLNLREFIDSKHIHIAYNILKSEQENWNIIGKTSLKSYDTEYNLAYFVCKCSSVKGLCLQRMPKYPKYYQECISSWVKLEGILTQKTKESILNSCLFGNKYIKHRNSPICISSFSKSNIKRVLDIRILIEIHFRSSSFSHDIIEILKGPQVAHVNSKCIIIDNELNIITDNKPLEHRNFKLKLIQSALLDRDFERKYVVKWETLFNQRFQWNQIWTSTLEIPLKNTKKEFQWKIIHLALFTEHKLFLMNMSNGLCHFCNVNMETITHLFYCCTKINWIIHE